MAPPSRETSAAAAAFGAARVRDTIAGVLGLNSNFWSSAELFVYPNCLEAVIHVSGIGMPVFSNVKIGVRMLETRIAIHVVMQGPRDFKMQKLSNTGTLSLRDVTRVDLRHALGVGLWLTLVLTAKPNPGLVPSMDECA